MRDRPLGCFANGSADVITRTWKAEAGWRVEAIVGGLQPVQRTLLVRRWGISARTTPGGIGALSISRASMCLWSNPHAVQSKRRASLITPLNHPPPPFEVLRCVRTKLAFN